VAALKAGTMDFEAGLDANMWRLVQAAKIGAEIKDFIEKA